MAGLTEVPVVVREMTEAEVMEFGLIENLQREDLNPLEEAGGYRDLIETFGLTQEAVARKSAVREAPSQTRCGFCACRTKSIRFSPKAPFRWDTPRR